MSPNWLCMMNELWLRTFRHMDVVSMMQLEQTCRRLRTLCIDPAIWRTLGTTLAVYDHGNVIRPMLNRSKATTCDQRLLRRIVKCYFVLQFLPQWRPGDTMTYRGMLYRRMDENLSGRYRVACFLTTVPNAWKVLYFSALLDKPTHFWRLVGTPKHDACAPLQGFFQATFELTSRKRRRAGQRRPRVIRVVCQMGWDRITICKREFPMDAGDQGVLKVYWDAPMDHETRWTRIVKCKV